MQGCLRSISTDHRYQEPALQNLAAGSCAFIHLFHIDHESSGSLYNRVMEPLVIAGKAFQSRLIVGTGKYKDGPETQAAIEASGAEIVTVAVRRRHRDRAKESLLDFIDPQRYFL